MAANISVAMKHNDTNELSYLFSTNSEHQQLPRGLHSTENAGYPGVEEMGVEPCVQVSGVVYSNCNTGSQAANPVK